MKKRGIGYIFYSRSPNNEDKLFMEVADEKKVKLIEFNLYKSFSEDELKEKIKKCGIVFNNSAEEIAIEIGKTIETLGKRVVCSSKDYYNTEDKWMFYLKCMKHKIPVPRTILLSDNVERIERELMVFNSWPVILKRIEGTCGIYVEKADNQKDAIKIIKKFWNGGERLPIIAQEFIKSPSYRVLMVDGKTIQSIIKMNKAGWKSTGVYENIFKRFKPDKELKIILKKITKITKMPVCGIDLLKKDDDWKVLEINSSPGLDFVEKEKKKVIGKIVDFLKKNIK